MSNSNKKLSLEELNRASIQEFKQAPKNNIILVLDNVRSMNNVGSAFRTADAFACTEICLVGITAQPPHREISKTALGADESMAWSYFPDTQSCLKYLKDNDWEFYCVEQVEKPIYLQDLEVKKDKKYAFVFGNEVFGVSEEFIEKANACVEIPQFGTKHSLNVSVTMGVVVWDVVSKLLSQY